MAKPGHPSLLQYYTGLPFYMNYFFHVAEYNVPTPKKSTNQ